MATAKSETSDTSLSTNLTLDIDIDDFEVEVGTTSGKTVNLDLNFSKLNSSDLNAYSTKSSENADAPLDLEDADDSLNKFLSAVADQLDAEAEAKDRSSSLQEEMEKITLGETSGGSEDSLSSLMLELKQNITPEWLSCNTAERWQEENPDLAREFKHRMEQDRNKDY